MGRDTATPNPAPRRSRVEQEILRCAAIGEAADFTGAQWKRVKRVDGRVVVSGKFLADLWLGLTDCRVHPVGISLKGLHVDGQLALGGARVDARLRAPLVGLMADQCRFGAQVTMSNARVESCYFTDCEFHHPDGANASFFASSAELVGQISFNGCQFQGYCVLTNAVVDDDVNVFDCRLGKGLLLTGAEIRGDLIVQQVTVEGSGDPQTNGIDLFDTEVGGNIGLTRCRINGRISAGQLKASTVALQRVSLYGPAGLMSAAFSRIAHNLRIIHCRITDSIDLAGSSIGGQFMCYRSVIGHRRSQSRNLRMSTASVAMEVIIESTRVYGGILAERLDAGETLRLKRTSLWAAQSNLIMADFSRLSVGKVEISHCDVGGQMRFDNASMVRFGMENSAVSMTGGTFRKPADCAAEVVANGLTFYTARIEQDLVIAGKGDSGAVLIDGGISLQALRAGGQICLLACWLGRETMQHSVQAWGVKAASVIDISNSVMPAGFYAPNLETADLRLKSVVAAAPGSGPGRYIAVCMVTARISDSCTIGSDIPDPNMATQLVGSLNAADCEVANSLSINGLTMRLTEGWASDMWSGGTGFAGAKLGEVYIGDEGSDKPAAALAGCLVFDRASAKSLRLYETLSVQVRRKDAEQFFSRCESDATLRSKWGVALSLVGAQIERGLQIARPALAGMVDAKNLSVNSLVDQGGEGWSAAGVLRGQLRLDGLTYSDLDDDQIASVESRPEGGSTAKPKGAVARRLDWLAMQYPDGEPDASSFTPQPYEQLARHYAAMGDERARRQVLVRKRQLQRTHSGLGWIERTVSGLLGLTSDYGYSPGKASIASALVIALGALAAWGLHSAGAIAPAGDEAGSALFSPLLFALDVAVPFLDLGHDSLWRIDPTALPAWPGRTLTMGLAEALYRLAGLVMLSITVLTFSGILHEKE